MTFPKVSFFSTDYAHDHDTGADETTTIELLQDNERVTLIHTDSAGRQTVSRGMLTAFDPEKKLIKVIFDERFVLFLRIAEDGTAFFPRDGDFQHNFALFRRFDVHQRETWSDFLGFFGAILHILDGGEWHFEAESLDFRLLEAGSPAIMVTPFYLKKRKDDVYSAQTAEIAGARVECCYNERGGGAQAYLHLSAPSMMAQLGISLLPFQNVMSYVKAANALGEAGKIMKTTETFLGRFDRRHG